MRIVQRLDGLPLSIEMAAAQLDTTTADELADALDEHLDSLRSPRRHVPGAPPQPERPAGVVRSAPRRARGSHARRALRVRRARQRRRHRRSARRARRRGRRPLTGPSIARQRRSQPHAGPLLSAPNHSLLRRPPARRLRTRRRDGAPPALWFIDVARAADAQLRTVDEAAAHAASTRSSPSCAAYGLGTRHDVELAAELVAHLPLYAQSRFLDEPLVWGELLLDRLAADDPHRPVLLASAAWRALRRGDIAQARRTRRRGGERAGDTPPPSRHSTF